MTANRGRTTIRLREDLLERLRRLAFLEKTTLTALVNEAIERYVVQKEAERREALLKLKEAWELLETDEPNHTDEDE
jgi:predicted transcriptional regulator